MCGSQLALRRVPLGKSSLLRLGTHEDPLARAWEADTDDVVKASPHGRAGSRAGSPPGAV